MSVPGGITSLKPPSNFIYETLAPSLAEVRTLILRPSEQDEDRIICDLEKGTLYEDFQYVALSYAWGDPSATVDITVNGYVFPITVNLAAALRQIRTAREGIRLWVDAICIDQKNVLERNDQVQIMARIYSQASRVIAWLGEGDDDGELGLRVLRGLQDTHQSFDEDIDWIRKGPELSENGTTVFNGRAWNALGHLLASRPYWKRVWTLQERALARQLYFMCGRESFQVTLDIRSVLERLSKSNSIHQYIKLQKSKLSRTSAPLSHSEVSILVTSGLGSSLFYDPRTPDLVHSLDRVLEKSSSLQSMDPRDKVYGLLGLTKANIPADYKKAPYEVYTDAASWMLDRKQFRFLRLAGLGICQARMAGLPSWVPNWSDVAWEHVLDYGFSFNVWHQSPSITNALSNGGTLNWSGYVWDTISVEGHRWTEPQHLMKIDQTPELSRARYTSDVSLLEAFVLMYCGGFNIMSPGDGFVLSTNADAFQHILTLFLQYILLQETEIDGLHSAERQRKIKILESIPLSIHAERLGWGDSMPDDKSITILKNRALRGNRYMFRTEHGYIGFTMFKVQSGDCVCLLPGYHLPVILRKSGDRYLWMGVCFVVGLMQGEAAETIEAGQADAVDFQIM